MALRVALHHQTVYRYDRAISAAPHIVRLRPAPHCRTPVLSYSLKIEPAQHFINWQQDPQGNYLARLVFPERLRELKFTIDLVAEMTVINPFDFFVEASAETYPFAYEPELAKELRPFLEAAPAGPRLIEWLAGVDRSPIRTTDFLVHLNSRLQNEIKYLVRMEPGVQTPEETLTLGSGSCRDSAWLLVQILRNLGIAARFVSGYLIQLVPDVKSLDGPTGAAQDFTDLHAWAEAYLPGAGWIGLDPTSGLLAGEGHLPLAATPDPGSAAPITGAVDFANVEFEFDMSVARVYEDPRVTKPYTAEQWDAITALGHQVDDRLQAGDVRLTMGGEPTFVSIDDMEGDEWNTTAVGPTKRILSDQLIKRLKQRFAPGALLHFGQGKWYPGESLPRWAYSAIWRRDGQPIWLNPDLFANETETFNFSDDELREFGMALADRLKVDSQYLIPAWEDVWYYLWRERKLPVNVDPFNSNLKDPEERERLARIFEKELGAVTGFLLPVRRVWWSNNAPTWTSGPWPVRPDHMFLLPGDSPMGLRLPLDSLPWLAPVDYPHVLDLDQHVDREPLPDRFRRDREPERLRQAAITSKQLRAPLGAGAGGGGGHHYGQGSPGDGFAEMEELEEQLAEQARHHSNGHSDEPYQFPIDRNAPSKIVRTGLCIEQRHGRMHIFMPPTERLEDYLELVHAVEDTAEELQMPLVIEGYLPPHDPRINNIKVTPDPGVIEVNIQPAHNWDECVAITTGVYEDARQSRLGTEKFMLDGRHSGTGGGNHVVLGGSTPADSPFLRRPDLLRSLIGYWVNHPSLSYLFSGWFIGPTSQAPRVDEARKDSVYELEIAFSQIPQSGPCPPWLVDRIFRNLLVDLTGNTHRAEFCIDKLFSPDHASGRLGLVEFRGFEMPPHSQMSLTQQLLLRALVAKFWEQPYQQAPVRWGTTLHDRWMLPHFVSADFADVLHDLNAANLPLDAAWFAPHFEFRFPKLGDFTQRNVHVELRQAIEPWYVLGEEPAGGATVRYVDSSVERLQVKVSGLTDSRHVVTVNGRRVPLHPTGTVGEHVAGVRYRAWQPPNCLHPTIPIDTPLVFDLIDTWQDRSLGGCTYHVAHPGGRSYSTFPVNAYEAESRRVARFFQLGHTGGKSSIPAEKVNVDFPLTLDLRRG
jgi:uncharacterized protein (DUF2126 family)